MFYHLGTALISFFIANSNPALAQSLPGSELEALPPSTAPSAPSSGSSSESAKPSADSTELEELYDKDEVKADNKPAAPKEAPAAPAQNKTEMTKVPQAKTLSDLARLEPFSDIAVIEKRFLPKTGRFEFSASGFTNLNNPFFSSYGLGLEASYYLRERWAIGLLGDFSTSSAREVTNDLSSKRNINTQNLVTANGFYGAAIKWNPIYGKITWLNRSIVPFDLNFSVGGGLTSTTDGQGVPTVHLGTSQVFAWTKSVGLRWDFSTNVYQATGTDINGNKSTLTQYDLYLGFGVSFYFPEASYR